MAAFFLDDLILGIIRMIRRESRRRQTLRWSIAEGRFTRFTTSYGSPTVPLVDYEYRVNGRTWVGSATVLPIRDDRVNQIGDTIDSLSALRVRFDPINPDRSRILNEDNSEIPFEIDLLAY